MEYNIYNASIVCAHLTGKLEGEIIKALRINDYDTAIDYTTLLIRAYSNLEFNDFCRVKLLEWNKELEQYETIQTKRTAR